MKKGQRGVRSGPISLQRRASYIYINGDNSQNGNTTHRVIILRTMIYMIINNKARQTGI